MIYKLVRQHDEKDCGAACLSTIFRVYGNKEPLVRFRKRVNTTSNATNAYNIASASNKFGINADVLNGDFDDLCNGLKNKEFNYPFIAHILTENLLLHFVVVYAELSSQVRHFK